MNEEEFKNIEEPTEDDLNEVFGKPKFTEQKIEEVVVENNESDLERLKELVNKKGKNWVITNLFII
jgi:hypothetical protein